MPQKKPASADFRYATGAARVPWAAVGENVSSKDILDIVKFLIHPADRKKTQYAAQLAKVRKAIEKLEQVGRPTGKLSLAGKVQALEEQVAKFLQVKYTVFLTNATAGFEIALKFAGLGPGDEVIAPAITFIATIAYPLSIGAKVVLADVDPRTLNMDPTDVARKITRRTKARLDIAELLRESGGQQRQSGPE